MKGPVSAIILLGIVFTSCKTGSKTTERIVTIQRNIMPADSIIQKQKKGIDFYASGNLPATWSLEADFDKLISFRSSDGTIFNQIPNFDKKEISTETETYILPTDLGPVTIQVFNTGCSGNGEQYSKKVDISIKNKIYTGCGKYLFDHQLNDIWVLDAINGVNQSASGFVKGLPTIELNLQTNKMTGTDGCNNISSIIEVKGNRIKFSPLISTKMLCNNNKAEKIFSTQISNKLVDYYMENNKLVLYLEDDSKLSFKRKNF